ncbi:MAG TPA: TetR/AcrR family transcriptional regulator [Solirubrobacteraceae bacterium]|nr:TetR/AcrR family transcriptional regulator [Solirubrobacteraceae bacterium]
MSPDDRKGSAQVRVRRSDLSTYARIRNAALEGFAENGVAGTSIRDVAAAAGVSPGLVQHHFGTKSRLRDAVDEFVVEVAIETFRDLVPGDGEEVWAAMGATTTDWVRDNAVALRYVARSLTEGDDGAARTLDALVTIARASWLEPLKRGGALDPEVDEQWAALHVIVFNLATVLMEPAISAQLGAPFFSPEQLQRWNLATTQLYRRALTRPSPRRTRASARRSAG